MSGSGDVVRVGQIPAAQREVLHTIHRLARNVARLREELNTVHDMTAIDAMVARSSEIDLHRVATEHIARAMGVPDMWIASVRLTGDVGQAWREDMLLVSPPSTGRRPAARRVGADVRQLTDMALVTVARTHLLDIGPGRPDPDPAAAQQVLHNMRAVRARAARTADAIGMTPAERRETFTIADTELRHDMGECLRYSPADLDSLFHHYADPRIARDVGKFITQLDRDGGYLDPDPSLQQPATVEELLRRAAELLAQPARHTQAGTQIGAAIDAALPDTGRHPDWDPGPDTATPGNQAPGRDHGPSP